jgi:CrcB protein
MMSFLYIAAGGALGSFCRYALGKKIAEKSAGSFPVSTFLINVSGAVLLGVVSSIDISINRYALIGDGFLGAYTTFSTFIYEGFDLFRNNEKLNACVYIASSFVLGVAGYISGVIIFNRI